MTPADVYVGALRGYTALGASVARALRDLGFNARSNSGRSAKAHSRQAARTARWFVVVGGDELRKETITLREIDGERVREFTFVDLGVPVRLL